MEKKMCDGMQIVIVSPLLQIVRLITELHLHLDRTISDKEFVEETERTSCVCETANLFKCDLDLDR